MTEAVYGRDQARRSLVHTIMFRGVSQVATVLSFVMLARGLAVAEFGVLNLLYALIPTFTTLGSLGLDHVVRRFQPEFIEAGQPGKALWILSRARRLRALANLGMIFVMLALWWLLAPLVELEGHRSEFLLFSVLLLLHFQVTLLQYASASAMKHDVSVGSVALLAIGKAVGYGFLLAAGEFSVGSVLVVDTLGYLASYLVLIVADIRMRRHAAVSKPAPADMSRMKRYAINSHVNDTASVLQYSDTDRYFIAAMLNPVMVGVYAFYTRLSDMATSLIPQRIFDNVIQPMVFRVRPEEATQRLPVYVTFLINTSLAYQLPLFSFTCVFHQELVTTFFGSEYASYSYLLPLVIAFATTDWVFSYPIHLVAQFKEMTGTVARSQLFGLYQIGAMLLLVPRLGILGAALASGTFHMLRNAFVWWRTGSAARWLNAGPALAGSLLVWGVCIGVNLGLRTGLHWPALAEMILGALVCGLALIAHLHGPAVKESDREILSRLLGGRQANVLRWVGLQPRASTP